MRKRRIIVLAVAVVAVLGGVIWWAVATRPPAVPDPVYGGHRLSYWVNRPQAEVGPAMDSNAVPYLAQVLKRRDGPSPNRRMRFWRGIPDWLKNQLGFATPAAEAKAASCQYLGNLGPTARPAIPDLIHVLRGDDYIVVRGTSAWALGTRQRSSPRRLGLPGRIAAG